MQAANSSGLAFRGGMKVRGAGGYRHKGERGRVHLSISHHIKGNYPTYPKCFLIGLQCVKDPLQNKTAFRFGNCTVFLSYDSKMDRCIHLGTLLWSHWVPGSVFGGGTTVNESCLGAEIAEEKINYRTRLTRRMVRTELGPSWVRLCHQPCDEEQVINLSETRSPHCR